MKYIFFGAFLISAISLFTNCKESSINLSPQNAAGDYLAYVEIPAGTNLKLEYDKSSGQLKPDQQNGQDRKIDFLGYPGNYGFIPGTVMDENKGGDGDALDVLILGTPQQAGTVLEIIPIATLKLSDQGELDTKIIAVPKDPNLQLMKVERFSTLLTQYHMAQQIIQNWFFSYKGMGQVELLGWEDENYAIKAIEKWTVNSQSQDN